MYMEKTTVPEEPVVEVKAEPEPVYIDEVSPDKSADVFFWYFVSRVLLPLQEKMDKTLYLLQNTDPADASPDSTELLQLEGNRNRQFY